MSQHLLDKIAAPLQGRIPVGTPILVAFSGGPDSVALACILQEIGYRPYLAYVNHGLRGEESLQEERWVKAFAEEQRLPIFIYTVSAEELREGRGLQATARQIRYRWMEGLLHQHHIPWGATAHTQDDQVETLLYRLVRGRSPALLEGIPYRRGRWVRPLLYCRRTELLQYLRVRGVSYLLDSSNYRPKYLRNQLRWWALPALYCLNPNLSQHLLDQWRLYRLQYRRLSKLYRKWEGRWIQRTPFGDTCRGKAPWDVLYAIARHRWKLSWNEARAVWRLLRHGKVGASILLPKRVFVRVPEGLHSGAPALWEPSWPPLSLEPGALRLSWGAWQIETGWGMPVSPGDTLLLWDGRRLHFPLRLRRWQLGDKIAPTGMGGKHKRLSDVWPALGVYGFYRKHAFVVEGAEGQIIGAAYYRVAEGTAPPSGCTEIFYLRAVYGATTLS